MSAAVPLLLLQLLLEQLLLPSLGGCSLVTCLKPHVQQLHLAFYSPLLLHTLLRLLKSPKHLLLLFVAMLLLLLVLQADLSGSASMHYADAATVLLERKLCMMSW